MQLILKNMKNCFKFNILGEMEPTETAGVFHWIVMIFDFGPELFLIIGWSGLEKCFPSSSSSSSTSSTSSPSTPLSGQTWQMQTLLIARESRCLSNKLLSPFLLFLFFFFLKPYFFLPVSPPLPRSCDFLLLCLFWLPQLCSISLIRQRNYGFMASSSGTLQLFLLPPPPPPPISSSSPPFFVFFCSH